MNTRLTEVRAPGMTISRLLSHSHFTIALTYLAAYLLLDWISYVHPFALSGITPWNPQTGLSFALILLFGRDYIPWLLVAPLLAVILLRDLPLPFGIELLVALTIGSGYSLATTFLLSRRVNFDVTLSSGRSLLTLMTIAIISIGAVAALHAAILVFAGILQRHEFVYAAGQSFVGDVIGVTIMTPFLLILFTRKNMPAPSLEFIALTVFTLLLLWVVFDFVEDYRFQLFYVFFIPVIWTAVRFGLEGVTGGLVLTQIGLIAAIQMSDQHSNDVVAYQALMVVLAITGLSLGVLVNEQRRAQQQLRLQQEALYRASRIGVMGEFAAAVAHEINQPLTAIANYTRVAKHAAEKQPPDAATARDAAGSAIEQVDRAAAVIRRLRDFIRLGHSERESIKVSQLVEQTNLLCRPELEKHGVLFSSDIDKNLPNIKADKLQIQQVLMNLIRNSAEALAGAGRHDGHILVAAKTMPNGEIEIRVSDNGPGFDEKIATHTITPFTTTKNQGLGLGLSLVRSIVEAHDGKLTIQSGPRGATVSLKLHAAENAEAVA